MARVFFDNTNYHKGDKFDKNRMDRKHLESNNWMHQNIPWMQALLCGNDGKTFASYGSQRL